MGKHFKRVVHRFVVWGPPAAGTTYGAVLGIAATAAPINSDAKAFLDNQITMLRAVSNAPYLLAWLIGLVLLWLFAFLWSLEREEISAPHGAPGLIVWIREKIRNVFHKEFQAETKPEASLSMKVIRADQARYDMPIWQAVDHIRDAIGDTNEQGCYPETLRQIRQAALDGRITIWGKRELEPPKQPGHFSEVHTRIEPSYWERHKINSMAIGEHWKDHDHTYAEPLKIDGYQNMYWGLMANRAEIEKEWQRA